MNTTENLNPKVGKLEEESLRRKERLKTLRKQAEKPINDESADDTTSAKPVFRSYKPKDESIKEHALEQKPSGNIENEIKDHMELLKTPIVIEDVDIANLAPRKPDWDLKRDVARKLEKLERRTQRAIAELIRDRLKTEQNSIFEVATLEESKTSELMDEN